MINKINIFFRAEIADKFYRPKRVLFDHLPKCAGTTITEYLLMHYPRRFVFKTNGLNPSESIKEFKSMPKLIRYKYRFITGHLTNELFDYVHPSTLTFTILRDPIDRIVSHYFFVKQNIKHYLHDKVISAKIQLDEFVQLQLSSELRNWYTIHFTGLSIKEAEMDPGRSVQLAIEMLLNKFDIIGFQNNVSGVSHRLKNAAELIYSFKNKIRNRTKRRTNIDDVPESIKKIISETNFLDVKLFELLKSSLAHLN